MKLKTILIIALSFLMVQSSYANGKKKKKIVVSGYVTDMNDKPLKGVSFFVDKVKSNVHTNKKGFYKIRINRDVKTFMAYDPKHGGLEMEFKGHTKINFVLLPDLKNPNYINPEQFSIYDYGYGQVNEKNNTTSIGKIDNDESDDIPYTNIYQMIQGRIPGVIVSGSSITIRGPSSINAQGNPLFVVDGSVTTSIDNINPRDVKSISILKGAETAMYGVRGSKGVIVIKLKTGK